MINRHSGAAPPSSGFRSCSSSVAPSASAQRRERASSVTPPAVASSTRKTNAQSKSRPRLVLLIVVDQFRYDYLERFHDLFVPNGIKRLMTDGASWTQANYDHMPTYTAPGHATLMKGAWPAETGIVATIGPTARGTGSYRA